jgi:hypothetical protein
VLYTLARRSRRYHDHMLRNQYRNAHLLDTHVPRTCAEHTHHGLVMRVWLLLRVGADQGRRPPGTGCERRGWLLHGPTHQWCAPWFSVLSPLQMPRAVGGLSLHHQIGDGMTSITSIQSLRLGGCTRRLPHRLKSTNLRAQEW